MKDESFADDFFNNYEQPYNEYEDYFVIVIYDICNNKRRTRVSKCLESYGFRIQESAFECFLAKTKIKKMEKELKKNINLVEDSVKIYRMDGNDSAIGLGIAKEHKIEPFIVI